MERRTIVHLIRHGDAVPEPDASLETGVAYDALGLSPKGATQATALARRLAATTPLAAIYASPTRRARETADAVARAAALPVVIDERLREVALDVESLAGVPAEERANAVRRRLAQLADLALRDGGWGSVAGVEPSASVRARASECVAAIARAHPGAHVAVVSHAGTINAYLATILGVSRDFFFPIGTTSLSTVRIADTGTLVLRLNDIAHLERRDDGATG